MGRYGDTPLACPGNRERYNGYPTPLLDWTESAYIAAYFALRRHRETGSIVRRCRVYASDPSLVVDEFPEDLLVAGRPSRGRRPASSWRPAFNDDLEVPLDEIFKAALAAELSPVSVPPAPPGTPRVRKPSPSGFQTDNQERQAVEEIRQTLSSMFTSPRALLGGLKFLTRLGL